MSQNKYKHLERQRLEFFPRTDGGHEHVDLRIRFPSSAHLSCPPVPLAFTGRTGVAAAASRIWLRGGSVQFRFGSNRTNMGGSRSLTCAGRASLGKRGAGILLPPIVLTRLAPWLGHSHTGITMHLPCASHFFNLTGVNSACTTPQAVNIHHGCHSYVFSFQLHRWSVLSIRSNWIFLWKSPIIERCHHKSIQA